MADLGIRQCRHWVAKIRYPGLEPHLFGTIQHAGEPEPKVVEDFLGRFTPPGFEILEVVPGRICFIPENPQEHRVPA